MRIQHNIAALNAHRQMGINDMGTSKALEKLSSGFRINRAADDAAGLAISEKMRGQIRSLDQAMRNAQDGISLIQTAEGATQEMHAILQRMRELAVQASTEMTEADRGEIQKEVTELAEEIDRIATTTEFNTQKLLDGSFEGKFHIGANAGQSISVKMSALDAETLGILGEKAYHTNVKNDDGATTTIVTEVDIEGLGAGVYTAQKVGENEYSARLHGLELAGTTQVLTLGDSVFAVWVGKEDASDPNGIKDAPESGYYAASDIEVKEDQIAGTSSFVLKDGAVAVFAGVVAGDGDGSEGDKVALGAGDTITVSGIDITTAKNADSAITAIDKALDHVSSARSNLGAVQNRMEYTIANLGVTAENLTDAESRIRDVDMPAEVMNFTKFNILNQASIAMLAQANMQPQAVLQLLG